MLKELNESDFHYPRGPRVNHTVMRVEKRLRSHGRRMTAQRRAILDAMVALGCAQDAEAIYIRARREHPRIGLVTVYRTLDAFIAEGLAQRVFFGDGRVRYDLAQDGPHHHHLVCLNCGRVARVEHCRVVPPRRLFGYRVTSHRLELFGYCPDCRRDR